MDAVDPSGKYRNFLNLKSVVVGPKGERQSITLGQTGPGHYEARIPTKDVGSYLMNILHYEDGRLVNSQIAGASVNYSPEFNATGPNLNLLARLANLGGGKVLSPGSPNPFQTDREKTRRPQDLFEWLLKLAIVVFPLDVGVRRVQLDGEEWRKAARALRRWLFFWRPAGPDPKAKEPLSTLLATRDAARARTEGAAKVEIKPELFQPRQTPDPVRSAAQIEQGGGEGVESSQRVEEVRPPAAKPESETTTSRLLEAKRRAQRRKND